MPRRKRCKHYGDAATRDLEMPDHTSADDTSDDESVSEGHTMDQQPNPQVTTTGNGYPHETAATVNASTNQNPSAHERSASTFDFRALMQTAIETAVREAMSGATQLLETSQLRRQQRNHNAGGHTDGRLAIESARLVPIFDPSKKRHQNVEA